MGFFFLVVIVCLFCFNIRIDFISRTVRNEVIQLFERAKHHIPRYFWLFPTRYRIKRHGVKVMPSRGLTWSRIGVWLVGVKGSIS